MIYNPVTTTEGKKPFAVCVKGMYFPTVDLSLRLVEGIEVQRALGADKISLSIFEVHPNMMKVLVTPPPWSDNSLNVQVLEYYVQSGYMEVIPVSGGHFEIVAFNDCFYRNIYRCHSSILCLPFNS